MVAVTHINMFKYMYRHWAPLDLTWQTSVNNSTRKRRILWLRHLPLSPYRLLTTELSHSKLKRHPQGMIACSFDCLSTFTYRLFFTAGS